MAGTLTMEQANQAKLDQIAELEKKVTDLRDHIDEMGDKEISGQQLWLGGLPNHLTNVRNTMEHTSRQLRANFVTAFPEPESAPEEPNTQNAT